MGTSFYMVFDDLGNELYRSPQVGEYNLDVPLKIPAIASGFPEEGSYVANQKFADPFPSHREQSESTFAEQELSFESRGTLERRRSRAASTFERFLLNRCAYSDGTWELRCILDHTARALAPVDRITDGRALHHGRTILSGRLCGSKAVDELSTIVRDA